MSISRPLCSPLIPGSCARNTLGSNTKREDPAPSRAVRRNPWSSLPPCPKPGGCRAVCDSAVGLLCVHYNACGMDRIVSRSIPAMMLPWSRPSPGFPAGSRLRSRPQRVGVQDLAPGKKKAGSLVDPAFLERNLFRLSFLFVKSDTGQPQPQQYQRARLGNLGQITPGKLIFVWNQEILA